MPVHGPGRTLTRKQLGWQPVQPGLIPDLDQGHYFNGWTSSTAAAA